MLYVPILKWKAGEKEGLVQLKNNIKKNIIPLIELTPDVLEKCDTLKISNFWDHLFYFDVSYESSISDLEFVDFVQTCDSDKIIPVISINDSFEKIQRLCLITQKGLALRISYNDALSSDFSNFLNELFKIIPASKIDLILDVKEVTHDELNQKIFLATNILNTLIVPHRFKRVILASSSFPNSLKDCSSEQLTLLPRLELAFFNSVVERCNISIVFSDYTINHWSYFGFIPGMKPSFNIRYTTSNNYLVFKGLMVKKGGLDIENVRRGCQAIVAHPAYSGAAYSWGDNEISLKASSTSDKSGNLTTWRSIGVNHHITLTVNQFASLL